MKLRSGLSLNAWPMSLHARMSLKSEQMPMNTLITEYTMHEILMQCFFGYIALGHTHVTNCNIF